MEALGSSGPARNLFTVADHAELHLAIFRRRALGPDHLGAVDHFVAAARGQGIAVHVIEQRSRFDPRAIDEARRVTALTRPDLIESHHITGHTLAALTRPAATPWVAWHHGHADVDTNRRAYTRLDRWSLGHADTVITTCAAFKTDLAATGLPPDGIHVVHHAAPSIARPARTDARARLGLAPDDLVVLAIGRLSPAKGHDLLINECARFDRRRRQRLVILIAGDGPERDRLARQAARCGVRLRLDGHQSELEAYYASADVFALPSRSEGSPSVLLEAMAAGCAIVASAVGGVPEMVDDLSAILVPPGNRLALLEALGFVLSSPAVARGLGEAARRSVRRFSAESRAARILAIYRPLLQATGAAVRG